MGSRGQFEKLSKGKSLMYKKFKTLGTRNTKVEITAKHKDHVITLKDQQT